MRQVIENGGTQTPKKATRLPFTITQEQLSLFRFSEKPISISEVAKKINALIDTEQMTQLTYKQLTNWLLSINALAEQPDLNGKSPKRPTETGQKLGISIETRNGMNGEYSVVVYNKEAQAFIIDNIEAVISFNCVKENSALENQGRPWSEEQEKTLIDLFNKGVSVSEIASALKRNNGGIKARLKKLGLIEKQK